MHQYHATFQDVITTYTLELEECARADFNVYTNLKPI